MRSLKLFTAPLIASLILLALLAPAEAGLKSWLSGNGWNGPTGNGKAGSAPDNVISPVTNEQTPNAGSPLDNAISPVTNEKIPNAPIASNSAFEPLVTNEDITDAKPSLNPASNPVVTSPQVDNAVISGGPATIGMWTQNTFGSVYRVTIQTQSQNGKCVQKVKIGLQGSKLEKTLETKCSGSRGRRIRSEEDLLLIENPDENFCAFTTNKNEVYYLQDGKWKKGDFNGDNSKDKELTQSEITDVKDRIKKWQAFFEKFDKEMERIMNLKMAERDRFLKDRAVIINERDKEIQTYFTNVNEIYRLKMEERNRHLMERNNIISKIANEGWSDAVEKLQSAEDERREEREAELTELKDNEDNRFETVMKDIEEKVSVEEIKSDEEIRRLESLEAEEEKRALQELKENIKQGW